MKVINKNRVLFCIISSCLFLSACAAEKFLDTSTPALDKSFGESLKTAKELQKIAKDPNQEDVTTAPTSKELVLPFDNYVKGKAVTSPALQRPVSSSGGS